MVLRILVVDDEVFMRGIYSEAIRSAGFDVVESSDGYEAIQLVQTSTKEHFFALITDFMMPNLSGVDLIEKLNTANTAH